MDNDEIINTERMNLHTAIERCLDGERHDCKTVSAIMLYARLYHNCITPINKSRNLIS